MIDPDVAKVRDVECVTACPGTRVDDAIWQDHAVYDRHQGLRAGVEEHLGVDLAAALEEAEDESIASGATATISLSLATKLTFIGLNLAIQGRRLVQLPDNDLAQTVEI